MNIPPRMMSFYANVVQPMPQEVGLLSALAQPAPDEAAFSFSLHLDAAAASEQVLPAPAMSPEPEHAPLPAEDRDKPAGLAEERPGEVSESALPLPFAAPLPSPESLPPQSPDHVRTLTAQEFDSVREQTVFMTGLPGHLGGTPLPLASAPGDRHEPESATLPEIPAVVAPIGDMPLQKTSAAQTAVRQSAASQAAVEQAAIAQPTVQQTATGPAAGEPEAPMLALFAVAPPVPPGSTPSSTAAAPPRPRQLDMDFSLPPHEPRDDASQFKHQMAALAAFSQMMQPGAASSEPSRSQLPIVPTPSSSALSADARQPVAAPIASVATGARDSNLVAPVPEALAAANFTSLRELVLDGSASQAPRSTPPLQPLREALGERLQLQLAQRSEQAVVRLDPPFMGQIEIAIRHADGALRVTIVATNADVARQLASISDALRTDLAQRQTSDVSVSIDVRTNSQAGAQDHSGGRRAPPAAIDDPAIGRALAADAEAQFASVFQEAAT